MICAICYGVLRGHRGSQWRGTFDLHFDHQPNRLELKKSAGMGCRICRSILSELLLVEQKDRKGATWNGFYTYVGRLIWGWGELFRLQQIDLRGQSRFISAYLSEVPELEQASEIRQIDEEEQYDEKKESKIYRLDFKLKDSERVGTFVLEHTGDQSSRQLHTPFSSSTKSDEALEVAKDWINKCTSNDHPDCPNEPEKGWYPTRLIDLGAMVEGAGKRLFREDPPQIRLDDPARTEEKERTKDSGYVRLVENKYEPGMTGFYVTLSHCWGGATFAKLTEDKLVPFKKGISVKDLPQTFQDAIRVARRLGSKPDKVRYIWIDSLCIIQNDKPNDPPSEIQRADWLTESSQMHRVYKNSYCNISATAASDSTKGLFFKREPHHLWEDEINLNTEGIPGGQGQPIQRCTILDLSFWERNVDDAPVNRRAWVLQERLMAPRVLHFCQDQIAWECRKLDAAESFRDGVASFRLKVGDIERGGTLKNLVPHHDDEQMRKLSLSEHPDTPQMPDTEVYRHWQSVVERYSKTKLTKSGDKLIALSGIAKMMSGRIPGVKYYAGLWNCYLESQLLWRVDPVWENGQFFYPSQRPADGYRAPSFSWAAVDAPRGITYGEITDQNLLIKVEEVKVFHPKDTDEFGLVSGGHIKLTGIMKKIQLDPLNANGVSRYRWDLAGQSRDAAETYSNVYLDSPKDDAPDILGPNGRVYCLPAREDTRKYLICLLLQQDKKEKQKYRRIGLTKIPPYDKQGKKQVYDPFGHPEKTESIWIL